MSPTTTAASFVSATPPAINHKLVDTSDASYPIIDISGLDCPTSRAAVVKAITDACTTGGDFLITNHGIKQSTMDDLMKAVETFFALPLDEKMKYASNEHMPPVRYGGSSHNTDVVQLGSNHIWRDYIRFFGKPVIDETSHLWPTTPSNYTELTAEFLNTTWEIAMKLAGALSEGLIEEGKDVNYLESTLGVGLQTISCNKYPPCPDPEHALGVDSHTDPGALSVHMDNLVDGIQMARDGIWVNIPHVPGSLAVNLGDYFEDVSCGRYKAAVHRVIVHEDKARVSVAIGIGPEINRYKLCPDSIVRFV